MMKRNLTKQNLNSLFFAGLILLFSVVSRTEKDPNKDSSFRNNIQETSLTAIVHSSEPTTQTPAVPLHTDAIANENTPAYQLPEQPLISARSASVFDLTTGNELFTLAPIERWPIASITKLMTSVIALENIGWQEAIPISQTAVDAEGAAGNLATGERYNANDLIKAMLTISSNDAAVALSEFYGEQRFIQAMQKKAFELGMLDTSFFDPSGLSFVNQSNAGDLKKLVVYILEKHPELFAITRAKTNYMTELNSRAITTLPNINVFAGAPDFIGGKTGYIDSSGGNLLSIFQHQGHRILIMVFGADDRFATTKILYNWVQQAPVQSR